MKKKLGKNDKMQRIKKKNKGRKGILFQMAAGFFIPIILIIFLGSISYSKASYTLISNYKLSKLETMDAISLYMNLMLEGIAGKTIELINDSKLITYYTKVQDMQKDEYSMLYRDIKADLLKVKSSTSGVAGVHIFGVGQAAKSSQNSNSSVSGKTDTEYHTYPVLPHSTSGELGKNAYEEFLVSKEGDRWKDGSAKEAWIGKNSYLDKELKEARGKDVISYIRKLSKGNGFIVTDVKVESISDVLKKMKMEDQSSIAFITEDKTEIKISPEEISFVSLPCYQDAVKGAENNGFTNITYNGTSYFFTYSKVGKTQAMVCELIPESVILAQADDIRNITIMIVIAAVILALAAGSFIAIRINRGMINITRPLAAAAKGDMRVLFDTNRQDEFGMLAEDLTYMTYGIRKLLGEVTAIGSKVQGSSGAVSSASASILESMKNIVIAITEIEKGAATQAGSAEKCAERMEELSQQIGDLYHGVYEMGEAAEHSQQVVENGIVVIDDLCSKTRSTIDITKLVIEGIETLDRESHSIYEVITVINEIAEQTNLLSLNASIEAARAGKAGMGFAVVAGEIRKLADGSMEAAKQIREIIGSIQHKTKHTAVLAKEAGTNVDVQTAALDKTIQVFNSINTYANQLTYNLKRVSKGIEAIEYAKKDTLAAIQNISAVSEETAAVSEEVSATAIEQTAILKNMSDEALILASDAKHLEEAINQFQI